MIIEKSGKWKQTLKCEKCNVIYSVVMTICIWLQLLGTRMKRHDTMGWLSKIMISFWTTTIVTTRTSSYRLQYDCVHQEKKMCLVAGSKLKNISQKKKIKFLKRK